MVYVHCRAQANETRHLNTNRQRSEQQQQQQHSGNFSSLRNRYSTHTPNAKHTNPHYECKFGQSVVVAVDVDFVIVVAAAGKLQTYFDGLLLFSFTKTYPSIAEKDVQFISSRALFFFLHLCVIVGLCASRLDCSHSYVYVCKYMLHETTKWKKSKRIGMLRHTSRHSSQTNKQIKKNIQDESSYFFFADKLVFSMPSPSESHALQGK